MRKLHHFKAAFFMFVGLAVGSCGMKTLPIPPQDALPQAITDLNFRQDENRIVLNWTPPQYTTAGSKLPQIESFIVLRGVVPETEYCSGCPVAFTSSIEIPAEQAAEGAEKGRATYTEMVLRPGHRFFFKVRTKAGWRLESDDSNIVSFTWNSPARAPEALTAIPGDMTVILSWLPVTTLIDDQPLNEPLYQVYRSRIDGDYEPVGSPVSIPAYTDSGLINGQNYFYKVSALQLNGQTKITGLASRAAEAAPQDMTAPAPPRNVNVVQMTDGVRIIWEAGQEPDIAGYAVYRRAAQENTATKIGNVARSTLSFTDPTPVSKDGWYYAITAYDMATPANESPKSKEIFYESF